MQKLQIDSTSKNLISPNGNFYDSEIEFGMNPNLKFNLILDTTSPYIWIPSPLYKEIQWFKNPFDCDESSTCFETQEEILFNESWGGISGNVTWETLNISNRTINQTIILADNIDAEYIELESQILGKITSNLTDLKLSFQGVLGLGLLPSANNSTYITLVENLYILKIIEQRWFIMYLQGNPYSNEQYSEICFDEHPYSRMSQKNFNKVPLLGKSEWSFSFQKYNIDGQIKFPSNVNIQEGNAILASANQYIVLPPADYNTVINLATNSSKCFGSIGMFCQCENGNLQKFSNITIIANGIFLSIPPWAYVIYYHNANYTKLFNNPQRMSEFIENYVETPNIQLETNHNEVLKLNKSYSNQYGGYQGPFYPYANGSVEGTGDLCQILIKKSLVNESKWILGIPFLQNYVILFDEINKSIGFAPAIQPFLGYYKQEKIESSWGLTLLLGCIIMGLIIFCILFSTSCICKKSPNLNTSSTASSITNSSMLSVEDNSNKLVKENPKVIYIPKPGNNSKLIKIVVNSKSLDRPSSGYRTKEKIDKKFLSVIGEKEIECNSPCDSFAHSSSSGISLQNALHGNTNVSSK